MKCLSFVGDHPGLRQEEVPYHQPLLKKDLYIRAGEGIGRLPLFPLIQAGQGEALIGLLGPFWDSKGILTPEQFRRFCSETVPLLRFSKFVLRSDENFVGKAQLAHYGKRGSWSVTDDSGTKWGGGNFPVVRAELGSVTDLGEIVLPLDRIRRPTHLHVEVGIGGTNAPNSWDIWVYPARVDPPKPAGVLTANALDNSVRMQLENGGRVVVFWPAGRNNSSMLPIRFLRVFWSLSWFPKQLGTMGIFCDPKHPALTRFPTDAHSNWLWWELTEGSRAFILDETPPEFCTGLIPKPQERQWTRGAAVGPSHELPDHTCGVSR